MLELDRGRLAGLQAGLFSSLSDLAGRWQCQARFEPAMEEATRRKLLKGWQNAVGRALSGHGQS